MRRIFQANFVASLVVNFVEAGIDKAHDKVYDKVGLRVEDLASGNQESLCPPCS